MEYVSAVYPAMPDGRGFVCCRDVSSQRGIREYLAPIWGNMSQPLLFSVEYDAHVREREIE